MKQKVILIGLMVLMMLLNQQSFAQTVETGITMVNPDEAIKWKNPVVVTNYSPRGDKLGGNFTTACGTTVKFIDSYCWSYEKFIRMYPNKKQANKAFMYRKFGTVAMARGRAKELGVIYGSIIIIKDLKNKNGEYIPLIVEDCYGPSKGVYYKRFGAHGSFDVCWSHINVSRNGTRKAQYAIIGYIEDDVYKNKNKLMGYKHVNLHCSF